MDEPNLFSRVDEYLSTTFFLEDEALVSARESVRENGLPEHSVSAVQGQFLYLLARTCGVGRIVEVGTLGGYSTIWLARALSDDGILDSIEIDPVCVRLAKENIGRAGLSDKVTIHEGEGLSILRTLEENERSVDLFFMDADKPNYVAYYEWALENARPGSLILADNVIREGQVIQAHSKDEKVTGVRRFLEFLSQDDRAEHTVLQQVGEKGYDGLAISRVK